MKVKANAGTLSKLLQIVVRAVPNRPTLQLLTAVLIEAKEGVLRMSATDMEISLSLGARAPIEEEGRAAVPARVLAEILGSLPAEEVLLQADEKAAAISHGKNAYELRTFGNPHEFPKLPAFPEAAGGEGSEGRVFSVPTGQLAAALAKVAPSVSRDEQRPVLTGVLVSFADGGATMVATDGYRMALNRARLEGARGVPGGAAGTALIPGRALKEVVRLSELAETATVALTENAALFSMKGVVFSTRLIDGNYPEYGRLLPDSCEREFAVETAALRATLRRLNIIAGRQSPPAPVKLAFSRPSEAGTPLGGELTISVRGSETGRATETIPAEVPEGEGFEACFNPSSLLDGADAVEAQKIRLLVDAPQKPILLTGPSAPGTHNGTHNGAGNGGGNAEPGGESDDGADDGAGNGTGDGAARNGAHRAGEFLYMTMPVRDPAAPGEARDAEETAARAGGA